MSRVISLVVSGWMRTEIENVYNPVKDEDINVDSLTTESLQNGLKDGTLVVSLKECLENAVKTEIELSDFEVQED